jgi:peroxiredoxin
MAATSTMTELGSRLPSFALPDVTTGRVVSDADVRGTSALLVMFICRHCPYVAHVREEIAQLAVDYADADLSIVGISSNDPQAYPEDAPESLAEEARRAGYRFPYLFDETQEVAKAFGAACTPDFFLYDASRQLVYRGQLDDSRPRNGVPVTGKDLRAAIDAVLERRTVSSDQRPSVGCSIKWKPGNEPG